MQRCISAQEAVSQRPQSTAKQIKVIRIRYDSVTSRMKQVWMQRRNDDLIEKSNKDSRHLWKLHRTRKRDSYPFSLPGQKEAFQTLYGAQLLKSIVSLVWPEVDTENSIPSEYTHSDVVTLLLFSSTGCRSSPAMLGTSRIRTNATTGAPLGGCYISPAKSTHQNTHILS